MNKPTTTKRWILGGVAAVLLGLTAVAGTSYATEGGMLHRHCRLHSDPAAMDKHLDAMVDRFLANGSAEQRAKVSTIAKAAVADLRPMRTQLQAGHKKAAQLLSQPAVDRAALEQLRLEQMQVVDSGTKRILQAVLDSADVLTPEQRTKLAEHLDKRLKH